MCATGREHPASGVGGFTLIELMIVVAIIGALATIALPMYQSAVGTARVQKAKQELRGIATDIDVFRSQNNGVLPLELADVGHGGRLDPWGLPYCYLNFRAGTGDGLEWAVDLGLVEPGVLTGSGATPITTQQRRTFEAQVSGITAVAVAPVGMLDPNSVKRRDRFLFPLNTDYDLFSLGGDMSTNVAVGDRSSLDDVIRANDGGFFGLASEY